MHTTYPDRPELTGANHDAYQSYMRGIRVLINQARNNPPMRSGNFASVRSLLQLCAHVRINYNIYE